MAVLCVLDGPMQAACLGKMGPCRCLRNISFRPTRASPFALLAMSTSNFENLSKAEWTLHHYAATVKKDLDAYHADSRMEQDWREIFTDHLVCFIYAVYFYKPLSDSFR